MINYPADIQNFMQENQIEQIRIPNELVTIPQSILMDVQGGVIHVLLRPQLKRIRERLGLISKHNQSLDQFIKHVIVGPDGAGKSLLIYICAIDCISSGNWLILYIESCSQFDQQDDRLVASQILHTFLKQNERFFKLHADNEDLQNIKQIAQKGASLESMSQAPDNLELLLHLVSKCNIPFFIGLDQWNCLEQVNGISQPLLKKIFGHFSKFKQFTKSSILLGVSSSFDISSSGMFSDFDAQIVEQPVSLYSKVEQETLVTFYRSIGTLPPKEMLNDDDLFKLAGYVPRLLTTIKHQYHNQFLAKNEQGIPIWDHRNYIAAQNKMRKYFVNRVSHIIQRHKNVRTLEFLAAAIINQLDIKTISNTIWLDAGLFCLQDELTCQPIVADVIFSVLTVYNDFYEEILEIMMINGAQLLAFDLFIVAGFLNIKAFLFDAVKLNNETDREQILLNIKQHVYQLKNIELSQYLDDTLIICYPKHPVVDCVIYSNNTLFLIYMSHSSFTAYTAIAQDIFTCHVGNSGKSVLKYYCDASPYGHLKKLGNCTKWTQQLKQYVKFLFITTDNTVHQKKILNISGASDVYRINGEQLQKFGPSYRLFG